VCLNVISIVGFLKQRHTIHKLSGSCEALHQSYAGWGDTGITVVTVTGRGGGSEWAAEAKKWRRGTPLN
jgi:hypothetical protein